MGAVVHCRLKIKLPGSVLAAQQGSTAGKGASKEGLDRWMAECADCGEEGDLLCCEVAGLHLQASSMSQLNHEASHFMKTPCVIDC